MRDRSNERSNDEWGLGFSDRVAYPGRPRGFGGGRYARPYSGPYGVQFRNDYRGRSSEQSGQFTPEAARELEDEKVASNYGGLRTHDERHK
ncbi:MAG TPA: hypothetical protein VIO33_11855 [Burkholderiaceae bacterium]